MKVYHVCSVFHDNCCDSPLFRSLAAALRWLNEQGVGSIEAGDLRAAWADRAPAEGNRWFTDLRLPQYEGDVEGEAVVIQELEVRA